MDTFCGVSGLKILSKTEWTNKKISDSCTNTFSILGNAILYSAPSGYFDLEGIQNSIQLKNEVKCFITEGNRPYFQILDYINLKGSAQAARKIFIKDLNNDERLKALIFCNLSLPLSTAVKIGKQFINSGKIIHIVSHYMDAVSLALKLCEKHKVNPNIVTSDTKLLINGSSYSKTQVEINSDIDWDIHTPELSSRSVIIDKSILHFRGIFRV